MNPHSYPPLEWMDEVLGVPLTQDEQFDRVIEAFARHNRRPQITPEERKRIELEAHRNNPKHIAALKRRRKRKRGGPK